MGLKNTAERYGSVSIALHWLMLLLFIGVYATIELRVNFPKGSDTRELLKHWHFMLGLAIFFLVWIRIAARVIAPTPKIVPAMPRWQTAMAKLMHVALYALMIVLPLAGWIILSAAGKPIPFFGLELPPLTGENLALSKEIKSTHELVGQIGYFLIAAHAVAALFHHYVQKDNTLTRMLPKR